MDKFNPASLSEDEFKKLCVPTAAEAKVLRQQAQASKNKVVKPAEVDEIEQAIAEERKQPILPAVVVSAPIVSIPKADKRIRVTFELPGGSYTVPAIDVKTCTYGIMVLLPIGLNDCSFSPSPGAELTVSWLNQSVKCFSPGTVFEIDNFNCIGVVLVRAET